MKTKRTACLLLGLSLASLTAAPPARAAIIGKSAEISIGREVAAQVEQAMSVDRDPVAVAKVRQIGRRLVSVSDNVEYPFEFHVVEGAEINAFALPGGYIYVYRGLIQSVPNDDALAFVIAHEISHVLNRHSVKQMEKNTAISIVANALLRGTAQSAAQMAQLLIALKFSRSDEADADETGMDLLHKAGYDVNAAAEAMLIVKRASGTNQPPPLLRSHPAPDSRVKSLQKMAAQLKAKPRVTVDAPPPPALETPELPGLDDSAIAPCPFLPLKPGARWTYRMDTPGGRVKSTLRVMEALPHSPRGVYRVQLDLAEGISQKQLIAPLGSGYLMQPYNGQYRDEWRAEAAFGEIELESGGYRARAHGEEKVTVPAGNFTATKVERRNSDGELVATAWYARGVGLVKRVYANGATEELETYVIPRDLIVPTEVEPKK